MSHFWVKLMSRSKTFIQMCVLSCTIGIPNMEKINWTDIKISQELNVNFLHLPAGWNWWYQNHCLSAVCYYYTAESRTTVWVESAIITLQNPEPLSEWSLLQLHCRIPNHCLSGVPYNYTAESRTTVWVQSATITLQNPEPLSEWSPL